MLVSALFSAFVGAAAAQTCATGSTVGYITNTNPPAPAVVYPAKTWADNVFNFRLTSAPSTTVTVTVSASLPNILLTPSTLTFTTANFATAQPVTIGFNNGSAMIPLTNTVVSFTPINTGGVAIPPVTYPTSIVASTTDIGCDANINFCCLC